MISHCSFSQHLFLFIFPLDLSTREHWQMALRRRRRGWSRTSKEHCPRRRRRKRRRGRRRPFLEFQMETITRWTVRMGEDYDYRQAHKGNSRFKGILVRLSLWVNRIRASYKPNPLSFFFVWLFLSSHKITFSNF